MSEHTPLLNPTTSSEHPLKLSILKTFLSFVGPGWLVAVGYLDPGNWATDLAAGSQFGYKLLFIIVLANVMAVLLQYLCIKLGAVTGYDLAQACRKKYSPVVNISLYILCEIAIIACDIAEVIGSAIALNLLFGLPIEWGVLLTLLDVLIVLVGWNKRHFRRFEYGVILLVLIVAFCFMILLYFSEPNWFQILEGLIPNPTILSNSKELYLSMGIIGATVMPHNLYLGSHIVKFRSSKSQQAVGDASFVDTFESNESVVDVPTSAIVEEARFSEDDEESEEANSIIVDQSPLFFVPNTPKHIQPLRRMALIPETIRYSNYDSISALSVALLINASILIVASANFFCTGELKEGELKDAYFLLIKHLGPVAGIAFAVALLMSGQSSTITGTLAGQIVMDGFLGSKIRVPPYIRRLFTRLMAVGPSLIVALVKGEDGVNALLVFSQVVLSLQLPFAVFPLVLFTNDKDFMTIQFKGNDDAGEEVILKRSYENNRVVKIIALFVATLMTFFNGLMVYQTIVGVDD